MSTEWHVTYLCVLLIQRMCIHVFELHPYEVFSLTSADAASQLATEGVNPGQLLPVRDRGGTLVRGGGDERDLVLRELGVAEWRGGGGGRRRSGGWGGGLGCVGGRWTTSSGLGGIVVEVGVGVGDRAGQVEAPRPSCDGRMEGELPRSNRGGGAGGDGERRRGGELAA